MPGEKNPNPVLGTIDCSECDQVCTVHATTRGKGRNLYTRCPECKADQRTGASFQKRLAQNTEWRAGMRPEWLENVEAEVPENAVDNPIESGSGEDWEPEIVSPDDHETTENIGTEQPEKPSKHRGLRVFGIIAALSVMVAAYGASQSEGVSVDD